MRKEWAPMLKFKELHSPVSLEEQFKDDLDGAVILMILFTVDPEDVQGSNSLGHRMPRS